MNKVLVFATTYPIFGEGDGTPSFVHDLNKRLVTQNQQIFVLVPSRPGSKIYEEKDGVIIHRYSYFFFRGWEKLADGAILPNLKKNKILILQIPFLLLGGFISLIFYARKYKVTHIHAHRIFSNGRIAAIYKKIINPSVKLICTSHGSDLHSLKGYFIDKLKRWTVEACDVVTVVSEYLQSELDDLMGSKINSVIIPMGVDTEKFNPSKIDLGLKEQYQIEGLLILNVGRLAPEKGQIDTINLMPGILAKYKKAKLFILGEGPLRPLLQKRIDELGISDSVYLLGQVGHDELGKWYATCDFLIASSYKESYGLAVAEAIQSGCYVFARDIPAFKIFSSKSCFLFKDIESIIKKIKSMLEKSENSDHCSYDSEILSWEESSALYQSIYEN